MPELTNLYYTALVMECYTQSLDRFTTLSRYTPFTTFKLHNVILFIRARGTCKKPEKCPARHLKSLLASLSFRQCGSPWLASDLVPLAETAFHTISSFSSLLLLIGSDLSSRTYATTALNWMNTCAKSRSCSVSDR